MLYFLHFRPGTGGTESVGLARRFAAEYVPALPGQFVGVTGTAPATVARSELIKEWVPVITLATIMLIALAVGLFYRSPIAPLVILLTAGISFVVASGVLGWLGRAGGLVVPPEVEPVVIALMFGVVTDYSIFFRSHYRRQLREGRAARDAARRAASEVTGIVLIAGLVVTVSTGALVFAELSFFQVFGPALAVAVLAGALVTATFMPCVLALLGRFALWPAVPKTGAPHPPRRIVRAARARTAEHLPRDRYCDGDRARAGRVPRPAAARACATRPGRYPRLAARTASRHPAAVRAPLRDCPAPAWGTQVVTGGRMPAGDAAERGDGG